MVLINFAKNNNIINVVLAYVSVYAAQKKLIIMKLPGVKKFRDYKILETTYENGVTKYFIQICKQVGFGFEFEYPLYKKSFKDINSAILKVEKLRKKDRCKNITKEVQYNIIDGVAVPVLDDNIKTACIDVDEILKS